MKTEETPHNRAKFVLLCDFWDAYKTFELKQTTSIPEIDGTIRPQIITALKNAVNSFESIELAYLRSEVQRVLSDDAYIITLDGGVIFNRFDFSIEITRACTKIADANIGPYVRMPRPSAAHLNQQFIDLKADFSKTNKKEVILCDDGIGTGGTVKRILNGLKEVQINVDSIFTITNPNNLSRLDGVSIRAFYTSHEEYNWLNERDMYWGLPRSGLSIGRDLSFVGLGGIPYTINKKMVISRIGIAPDKAEDFREACIAANMTFWKLLEKFHGRKLEIRDCARLKFFSKIYSEDEEVVRILNDCRTIDILNSVT